MNIADIEQSVAEITGGNFVGEVIVAIILLCLIALLTHVVVMWVRRIMRRDNTPVPETSIFVNIVRVVIWGIGICFVLASCFKVDVTALVAALGVGGIALSLGLQDTLKNLIGGVQVSFMRIIKPGDNIQVGTSMGVVQDITWRHTTIKNRLGETVLIPNSVIATTAVTHLPPPERVVVPFVMTTGADMDVVASQIAKTARITAEEYAHVVGDPVVLFTEVIETGVRGKVTVLLDDAAVATATSDAITRSIAPLVR